MERENQSSAERADGLVLCWSKRLWVWSLYCFWQWDSWCNYIILIFIALLLKLNMQPGTIVQSHIQNAQMKPKKLHTYLRINPTWTLTWLTTSIMISITVVFEFIDLWNLNPAWHCHTDLQMRMWWSKWNSRSQIHLVPRPESVPIKIRVLLYCVDCVTLHYMPQKWTRNAVISFNRPYFAIFMQIIPVCNVKLHISTYRISANIEKQECQCKCFWPQVLIHTWESIFCIFCRYIQISAIHCVQEGYLITCWWS